MEPMPEEEEYEAPEESVNIVLPTYDQIKQTMSEFVASEGGEVPATPAQEQPEADEDYW